MAYGFDLIESFHYLTEVVKYGERLNTFLCCE